MNALEPRKSFLANDAAVKRYRQFVDDPVIQTGIQSVLIEYMQTNPSQEAMRGANYLARRLMEFTEKDAPVKSWPDHAQDLWKVPKQEKKPDKPEPNK